MFNDDMTRIRHMLDSSMDALSFIKNKQRNDLDQDRMLVLSLVKCIEIIGEAASKISDDLKSKYPAIPWKDIIGMRNRLIHTYFDIDYDIVWKTVKYELLNLVDELKKLLSSNHIIEE